MTIIVAVIAIAGALIHLAVSRKPRTAVRVLEIFLLWGLGFTVGVAGVLAFYAHVFRAAQTAKFIGWAPGSPFQFEIGIANLGMGVLGLLCIWRRDDFWLATIIINAVFGWGAAVGHIMQIVRVQNYAPGNAGAILYSDILVPVVLISLFVAYRVAQSKQKAWVAANKERLRAA